MAKMAKKDILTVVAGVSIIVLGGLSATAMPAFASGIAIAGGVLTAFGLKNML